MKPVVANNQPAQVSLEKGKTYFFCVCGRSTKQPYCDGSHRGTEYRPMPFEAKETGDAWLCQCKHSSGLPFCDGTHQQFDGGAVGKEGPGGQVQ